MNEYYRGFFTAVGIMTVSILFIGSQSKSVRNIEADSILITGAYGNTSIQGGSITMYNRQGKEICILGTSPEGSGLITTSNIAGEITCAIGVSDGDGGLIQTFSNDGNQTCFLGTNSNSDGILSLKNNKSQTVVWVGASNNQQYNGSGSISLFESNGELGWRKSCRD